MDNPVRSVDRTPYYPEVMKLFYNDATSSQIDKIAKKVISEFKLETTPGPLSEYQFTLECHVLAASHDIAYLKDLLRFLLKSGRFQKALDIIDKFIKSDTSLAKSSPLAFLKVEVLVNMGRYQEALTIIHPLLTHLPILTLAYEWWIKVLYLNNTLWEKTKDSYPELSAHNKWQIEYHLGRISYSVDDIDHTFDPWAYALYLDKIGSEEERNKWTRATLVNCVEFKNHECLQLIKKIPYQEAAKGHINHFLSVAPYDFDYKYLYHSLVKNPELFKKDFDFLLALYAEYKEEGTAIQLMALASTLSDKEERAKTCRFVLSKINYSGFSSETLSKLFSYLNDTLFDDELLKALNEVRLMDVYNLPLNILFWRALLNKGVEHVKGSDWLDHLFEKNMFSIELLELLADYHALKNDPEKELIYLYQLRKIRTIAHIPLVLRIIRVLNKIDPNRAVHEAILVLKNCESMEVVKEIIRIGGVDHLFELIRITIPVTKSLAELIWNTLKTYKNFNEIFTRIPCETVFSELLKLKVKIKDYPSRLQDLELLSRDPHNKKERTELASHYVSEKRWDLAMDLYPHVEFEHLLGMIKGASEPGAPRVSTLLQKWTRKGAPIQSEAFEQTYINRELAEIIWLRLKSLPDFEEQVREIPRDPLLTEIIKLRSFLDDSPEQVQDLEFLAKEKTHISARTRLALHYYRNNEPAKAEALFPEVDSLSEIVKFRTQFLLSRNLFKTIIELGKNPDYIQHLPFKKGLVTALIEGQKFHDALKSVNSFLKEFPDNKDLIKLKVRALIGIGTHWTLAEDILNEELKKDPNNKAFKKLFDEVQTVKLLKKETPPAPPSAPTDNLKAKETNKKPSAFKSGLIEDKPVSKREKFPEKFLVKPTTDENVIRASFGSLAGQVDPLKPIVDLKAIKAEAAKGERQAAKEEKKTIERTVKPVAHAKVIAKTDLETWNRAALKYGADKLDEILKLEQGYDLLQDPLKEKIRFNNGLYAIYRSLEPISRGVVDSILKNKLSKMRNNARHSPHQVAQKDMSDLFAYFKSKNLSQQLRDWAGDTGALTSLVLNNPLIEIQEKAETDEELLLRMEKELQFMRDAKGKEEDFSLRSFHVNALKSSLSIIGDASKKLSKPLKEKIGHLFKDFRREGDLIAHFEMNEYHEFNEISPEELWKVANEAENIIRKMKIAFAAGARS